MQVLYTQIKTKKLMKNITNLSLSLHSLSLSIYSQFLTRSFFFETLLLFLFCLLSLSGLSQLRIDCFTVTFFNFQRIFKLDVELTVGLDIECIDEFDYVVLIEFSIHDTESNQFFLYMKLSINK